MTAAWSLAASATGQGGASAAVTSAGTRLTGILDTASAQLLDIAGGLV